METVLNPDLETDRTRNIATLDYYYFFFVNILNEIKHSCDFNGFQRRTSAFWATARPLEEENHICHKNSIRLCFWTLTCSYHFINGRQAALSTRKSPAKRVSPWQRNKSADQHKSSCFLLLQRSAFTSRPARSALPTTGS